MKGWRAWKSSSRGQPTDREGSDRADGEHVPVVATLEAFQQAGDAVEGVTQHRQQALALVGQHQAARQTLEQGHAETLLEALHLVADRRLGPHTARWPRG